MDRITNYIYLFLLIFLFVLEGRSEDHLRVLIALILTSFFSIGAFLLHWISLDAVASVIVVGSVVLGLGGWALAGLVLVFFISSSLLSKNSSQANSEGHSSDTTTRIRRTAIQVWANGFWVASLSIVWFLFKEETIFVMAAAAIATVTADTWATELGRKKGARTYLITDFRLVEPGTDGGISRRGTLASLAGALLIAVCYRVFIPGTSVNLVLVIASSGFFGCLVDSWLGAVYQYRKRGKQHWFNRFSQTRTNSNNTVNWLASGAGVMIAFILLQLIGS